MVRVKICGITNVHDARMAVRLGADALGFNFYPRSPRYLKPERVKAIVAALPPFVSSVGVFVDETPEEIMRICTVCGLAAAQMHGNESPAQVAAVRGVQRIKGIRVADKRDIALCQRYHVDAFLLDAFVPGTPGGTGKTFNWNIAREARQFGSIILAGGLTPENVGDAIRIADPYCVDVASGVESAPGEKDKSLVAEFIRRAKQTGA